MGFRTELAIDGDKCRRCGSLLALEAIVLDRHEVIEDGIAITMVGMLCRNCFAVAEIPYWGELLPSKRMLAFRRNGNRHPRFACAQTLER